MTKPPRMGRVSSLRAVSYTHLDVYKRQELGQTGGQVGGVALLAGHLLQAAGHLTQGLGPAGGGVSQNGDVIALSLIHI